MTQSKKSPRRNPGAERNLLKKSKLPPAPTAYPRGFLDGIGKRIDIFRLDLFQDVYQNEGPCETARGCVTFIIRDCSAVVSAGDS